MRQRAVEADPKIVPRLILIRRIHGHFAGTDDERFACMKFVQAAAVGEASFPGDDEMNERVPADGRPVGVIRRAFLFAEIQRIYFTVMPVDERDLMLVPHGAVTPFTP